MNYCQPPQNQRVQQTQNPNFHYTQGQQQQNPYVQNRQLQPHVQQRKHFQSPIQQTYNQNLYQSSQQKLFCLRQQAQKVSPPVITNLYNNFFKYMPNQAELAFKQDLLDKINKHQTLGNVSSTPYKNIHFQIVKLLNQVIQDTNPQKKYKELQQNLSQLEKKLCEPVVTYAKELQLNSNAKFTPYGSNNKPDNQSTRPSSDSSNQQFEQVNSASTVSSKQWMPYTNEKTLNNLTKQEIDLKKVKKASQDLYIQLILCSDKVQPSMKNKFDSIIRLSQIYKHNLSSLPKMIVLLEQAKEDIREFLSNLEAPLYKRIDNYLKYHFLSSTREKEQCREALFNKQDLRKSLEDILKRFPTFSQ